jgi:tetratricopeptide (TPR) repeat protein
MGFTLRRMGKWHEAVEQFEVARQLIPRSYFVTWDALAYTNAALHRFDDAEQYFDQAISLAPHQTVAYIGKAFVLLARNGDVDAARRVMSEMSRRANIMEEAERVSTEGLLFFSDLRFHPETYKRAFEAFESGPMNRYRMTQPAVVASSHLYQAMLIEAAEGRRSASAQYDSATVQFERIIRLHPQSAQISRYHAKLGLAYAGLNRKEDAIREGERAARMSLAYKDVLDTYETGALLAEIYMRCGEHEKAIDQLKTLLSTPGPDMGADTGQPEIPQAAGGELIPDELLHLEDCTVASSLHEMPRNREWS